MLWNESHDHDVYCYLCNITLIKGFNAKNKQHIVYEPEPKRSKKNPILFD